MIASEPSAAQHDVAGLQIAMQDADRMHDLPAPRPSARDCCNALRRIDALRDVRAQIAAREVFHRDVGVIVGNAEIEDAHHVRMADLRDQLVFLQEARELHVLVARLRRIAQYLEHDHLTGALALGQIHHRSAADRELAHEAMARESSPGRSATTVLPAGRFAAAPAPVGGACTASRSAFANAAMIDALAHQAVDGAALDDAHSQRGIIAAREVDHRRKAGAMHEILEPSSPRPRSMRSSSSTAS